MENHSEWDDIFTKFAIQVISPEGKMTFETSYLLTQKIIQMLSLEKQDIALEMGSGWGNLSLQIAPLVKQVIAIEPSKKNAQMAMKKAAATKIDNIHFIQGNFEKPNYRDPVDKITTSLVFHQVPYSKRQKSIQNIHDLLKPGGSFTFCDTFFFFDPENRPKYFNQLYRYLLPKTVPAKIYEKYIEPSFQHDPDYVYTWEDMKKYTPKNNWLYSINELRDLLHTSGFNIVQECELAPFFGIVKSIKPST